ncbi:MAG: hypothetical protein RL585_982 [Pseudomonadota bacterium]
MQALRIQRKYRVLQSIKHRTLHIPVKIVGLHIKGIAVGQKRR